jgi:hypothetical protein
MYNNLHICPLPNRRFKILEDYEILNYKIPAGYISNGADIPRIFWSYKPPNDMDILPAVVLHDYLCSKANIEYERTMDKQRWYNDRIKANNEFAKVLKILEQDNRILEIGTDIGLWLASLYK